MYDRVLKRMREAVRTGEYVMTLHAEEEMDEDGLTLFDVESAILTGRIAKRQKERTRRGLKYLVKGQTLAGDDLTVVARMGMTRELVVITVFRE